MAKVNVYRVANGKHHERVKDGERWSIKTFREGDEVLSASDLEAAYNKPGARKFEKVGEREAPDEAPSADQGKRKGK